MTNIADVLAGAVLLVLSVALAGCSSEPEVAAPTAVIPGLVIAAPQGATKNPLPEDTTTSGGTIPNMVQPRSLEGVVAAPRARKATAAERKAFEAAIAAQRARGPLAD